MQILNEAGMTDLKGESFLGADSVQVDRHIEGTYVDAWRKCALVMPKAWFKNERFDFYPKVENLSDGTGYIILPSDFYLLSSFKLSQWRKPIFDAYVENEKTSSIQSNEYTRGSEIRPVGTISNKVIDLSPVVLTYYQEETPGLPTNSGQKWYDMAGNNMTGNIYKPSAGLAGWEQVSFDVYSQWQLFRFGSRYFTLPDFPMGTLAYNLEEIKISDGITQVLNYYSVQKGLQIHTIEEAIYVPVATPIQDLSGDADLGLDHRIIEPMAYVNAAAVMLVLGVDPNKIAALEASAVSMFPALRSIKGNNLTFKQ